MSKSNRTRRPTRAAVAAMLTLTTAAGRPAADPAAVAALLRQGQSAAAAGQWDAARTAYAAAIAADPANPAANRGLGLVLVRQGDAAGAAKPLEVAAARGGPTDRSLALGLAATRVAGGSAMKAVKGLAEYLAAHPKPVDEPLVDALAVALAKAGPTAGTSSLFKSAEAQYVKLNAALEAARPGERRWGVQWASADEVRRKMAAWRKSQAAVADAAANVAQLERDRQAALDRARGNGSKMGHTNRRDQLNAIASDKRLAQELADQQPAADAKLIAARAALADVPGPSFPDAVAVDSLEPPPAVASVDPPAPPAPGPASVMPPAARTAQPARTTLPPDDAHPTADAPPAAVPVAPVAEAARRAVGFAVAPDWVVTTAVAVAGAARVHVDTSAGIPLDATVVRTDAKLGLTLLKIDGGHLPSLTLASTVRAGPIRCGGYPTADLFNDAAQLMTGTADAPPTDGRPWTVKLSEPPRLAGGPLLAADGSVVGVEMGGRSADGVVAVTPADLRRFVGTDAHPTDVPADPRRAVVQVVADPE